VISTNVLKKGILGFNLMSLVVKNITNPDLRGKSVLIKEYVDNRKHYTELVK